MNRRTFAIVHMVALPILLGVSWLITVYLYAWWTESGRLYFDSFNLIQEDVSSVENPFHLRFLITKGKDEASCQLVAQTSEFRRVWLAETKMGPGGIKLRIEIDPSVVDEPNRFGLLREIPIVALNSQGALFRFNRDIVFERPRGPLNAELRALARSLSTQGKQVISDEDARDLALRTSQLVDECHGVSTWGNEYWQLRLISGTVEQIIIAACVFCILVFLFEILLSMLGFSSVLVAVNAAEFWIDLVPYIGFFGTIYGMSEALWILGAIDISDPVEKATLIGPITGNISLAMETSQLGIIFFLIASLVARVIRIAIRDLD
ncbi:MotA/TolQ/ExbB proton channel family protein [Hyphomicrobiales bacterium]|uniref:MotA/TolQ/ExbB proton channel family protein n=1 Tax=Ensifer sp. R-19 TaxID=3404055 RepID=UPI000DE4E6E7